MLQLFLKEHILTTVVWHTIQPAFLSVHSLSKRIYFHIEPEHIPSHH